jgi:Putative homoserine kinase type II (protein kinase fold)
MSHSTKFVSEKVLSQFGINPDSQVTVFHGGHINDSFLVQDSKKSYMIQAINKFVFPSPENIMENMLGITEFLRKKIKECGGNSRRETLRVIKTIDGNILHIDENGDYWRCVPFIDNTTAYEFVTGLPMLESAGSAFGNFLNMLSDYPAETLHEIIKDFHNTPARYEQLMDAIKKDSEGRVCDVSEEIEFAMSRKDDCAHLITLYEEHKIPLRVTHNDTKMSNILFDNDTHQPICIIDLDTVMPGFSAFDFGDSIRAGATTAAEDEADLSKVHFNIDAFEAFAKGYLGEAGKALTEEEVHSLSYGAKLITLEVGMRFLADYLNGNVYFRTEYPEHNLVRARNQFKLVSEMETQMKQMDEIVCKYF